MTESKAQSVRSVEKALDILNSFSKVKPEMTLTEIALATGLPMATAYRLTNTLKKYDYIFFSKSSRTYRIGLKFFEVANYFSRRTGLIQAASPLLEVLSNNTGENASLSVFDGEQALCLVSYESGDSLKATINVGERVPLHAGALSRTILAFLPDPVRERFIRKMELEMFTENTITNKDLLIENLQVVRELGYAYSNSEAVSGVASLAAPIIDFKGNAVGAVAILSPAIRMPQARIDHYLKLLMACTAEISKKLGYRKVVNEIDNDPV